MKQNNNYENQKIRGQKRKLEAIISLGEKEIIQNELENLN